MMRVVGCERSITIELHVLCLRMRLLLPSGSVEACPKHAGGQKI